MSSNIYIPPTSTYYKGIYDTSSSLNLTSGDSRYLRIGGNAFVSSVSSIGNVDAGSITIGGSPVNFSAITGITAGTATASKALVLDNSLNISDINTIIANRLDFNPSSYTNSSERSYLRKADTNYAPEFYTLSNTIPSLYCRGLGASPNYIRFINYLQLDDNSMSTFGLPFDIRFNNGLTTACRGWNITNNATTSPFHCGYNTVLSARNGTIAHLVVNDYRDRTHLRPQDLTELTSTTYTQGVVVGSSMLCRGALCLGTSQDTGRLLSCLDSGMTNGTSRYITLGKANSVNNQAEISYSHVSDGSANNGLVFGRYGGDLMSLRFDGLLSVYNGAQTFSTKQAYIQYGRSMDITVTNASAWSIEAYVASSVSDSNGYTIWGPATKGTNHRGIVVCSDGSVVFNNNSNTVDQNPIASVQIKGNKLRSFTAGRLSLSGANSSASYTSINLGLFCDNGIATNDAVYSLSDRRLKENIESLELAQAKKLLDVDPKMYLWKDRREDAEPESGLIAQDLMKKGLEDLVGFIPLANGKTLPEDPDFSGFTEMRFSLKYDRLSVYLLKLVQDLYKQIEKST